MALPQSFHEAMLDEGAQWLTAAATTATETAPGVEVRTELASGFAAEQLIGRSASAALVVLGSRGLSGFSGLVVGSIAVATATHGHCPVVVVRGDAFPGDADGRPVVVGVDGSTARSDVALSTGWEVVAWPEIEADQHTLLTERLADAQSRYPDVPVQLVVVGSRGRGGFRGLLLGSTSQALIYHSPCPVAVVPLPRQ